MVRVWVTRHWLLFSCMEAPCKLNWKEKRVHIYLHYRLYPKFPSASIIIMIIIEDEWIWCMIRQSIRLQPWCVGTKDERGERERGKVGDTARKVKGSKNKAYVRSKQTGTHTHTRAFGGLNRVVAHNMLIMYLEEENIPKKWRQRWGDWTINGKHVCLITLYLFWVLLSPNFLCTCSSSCLPGWKARRTGVTVWNSVQLKGLYKYYTR